MNKKYLYSGLAVIGVVVLAVAYYLLSGKTEAPGSAVPTGAQEVHGQVSCLPHKDSGPQTLECAYGLKDSGGKYYGITGASREITGYHMGDEVVVSGTVSAPKTDSVYDVVGNIEASSIHKAN
jgi:hypothetical protein